MRYKFARFNPVCGPTCIDGAEPGNIDQIELVSFIPSRFGCTAYISGIGLLADRWQPFIDRMNSVVIPNTAKLIADARSRGVEVLFARIACLKEDGRDRSLSFAPA